MKDYFNEAISFESLYKALKKSCKNVRWKDSVVGYEANGLKNTLSLRKEILDGTYQLSPYQHFVIYEPKKREIAATRIKDRQFQRSLCDNGVYDDLIEHFIRDNCACQKGKGTDDAIARLKTHLHRHYNKYGTEGWVLKCDVSHFFSSIDHDVAVNCVNKYIGDKEAAKNVSVVISSFDEGLGLGSQISQLIALSVLNNLDHVIKEKLHVKGYVRYMDDFILISNDKEHLKHCLIEIEKELSKIGLNLNSKTSLFPLKQGIWFLKWKFILTDSGKVLMLIDKKKISRQHKRMKKLAAKEKRGDVPSGTTRESLNSWIASAKRGNTYKVVKNMENYYDRLELDG